MTSPGDHYDGLAEALRELALRLGASAFSDRRRLISLLSDRLPEARREIRLVGTAVDEGVPAALAGAERHLVGMEMDRQASRLEAGAGLRPDLARAIVRAFAYSLDLGPLPSVYQDWSAPVPGPAPTSPQDAWAGLSAPVQPPFPMDNNGPPRPPGASGFRFDQKYMLAAAGAVVLMVGVSQMFQADSGGNTTEVVDPGPGPGPEIPEKDPAKAARDTNFAGELDDLGIAAKATLEPNVGSATPLEIPAGRRLSTQGVQRLVASDASALLVDVLDNPHASTIRGAAYLPVAGKPGTFDDPFQREAASALEGLVKGKKERPLIFFCMGAFCWESYNAVLRANAAGYRNLYWYRGGLASWSAAGLPMQPLQAQPPAGIMGGLNQGY